MITNVAIVTKVAWIFPNQSLRCAETHACLHVQCLLLLLYFNRNWNVSTNCSRTPQYQISRKSDQLFLSYFMRTDNVINRRFEGCECS
jgi:hypothetical protein